MVPPSVGWLRAVREVEIDRDAVGRRRIADGIAAGADATVIDVVATALSADDVVVAAAGIDDVVAAAGMDVSAPSPVTTKSAPEPVVTCAVPVPVSVTVVGTSYGMVKSRSLFVFSVTRWTSGAGGVANTNASPALVPAPAATASPSVAKPTDAGGR